MHMKNRALMRRLHDTPCPIAVGVRWCPAMGQRSGLTFGCVLGLVLLMGCATPDATPDGGLSDAATPPSDRAIATAQEPSGDTRPAAPSRAAASMTPALYRATRQLLQTPPGGSPWAPWPLPGKTFAAFVPVVAMGQPAIMVKANRSVSILRTRYAAGLEAVGLLSFSWRIDALAEGADLTTAEADDSPVRIVLVFDGDRSRLSPRVHRLSEMSRLLTGEELPYATLAYVWSNADTPGAIVTNRRSDRIRKIVVESGSTRLGQWLAYERDVQADFRAAFGEAPGPLVAVALMTDTDNTNSRLRAWYGPLQLSPADH
jgi:hypothetical protein